MNKRQRKKQAKKNVIKYTVASELARQWINLEVFKNKVLNDEYGKAFDGQKGIEVTIKAQKHFKTKDFE